MRYFITPSGLEVIDDEQLPKLFKRLCYSQIEPDPVHIESFNFMVNSPMFLFKRLDVADESLYPMHNKRLPSTLYLTRVNAEEESDDYRIVVRNLYYAQTEGFLVSVFCIPSNFTDIWFRKFHIDQYLNDNP